MIEATTESFPSQVLASPLPVVVDFWAPWCGPCKMLAPSFEALAAEYEGRATFVKVNIDETEIAADYGVRGIPTLMVFKDGKPVSTKTGAVPKSALAAFIDSAL